MTSVVDRRAFLAGTLGLFVAPLAGEAQPSGKVPRIGFLRFASPQARQFEAFRDGLKALGYVEGQTISIEQRYAEGVRDRFPGLAAELVRLKVDLLVVDGFPEAAKSVTGTIPVIFTLVGDPVSQGLVASLARPGGNLTGLTLFATELAGKRLELLKAAVPMASRVAVLANPTNLGIPPMLRETEVAARTLGLQLQTFEVRTPNELDHAFEEMTREGFKALVQGE